MGSARHALYRRTSRSGSRYGSGDRSTLFTTEKTAVLAPMPNASVRIATRAKAGLARSERSVWRRSKAKFDMREFPGGGAVAEGARAKTGLPTLGEEGAGEAGERTGVVRPTGERGAPRLAPHRVALVEVHRQHLGAEPFAERRGKGVDDRRDETVAERFHGSDSRSVSVAGLARRARSRAASARATARPKSVTV